MKYETCNDHTSREGSVLSFPRFRLVHRPTPLTELGRFAAALARKGMRCPRLLIKRDDCTGLAGGGNKTRKLEFLLGEAMAAGADTLVTTGAIQSNHARQTAAAAAAAGLHAKLILFDTVPYMRPGYRLSGNRLLDRILGAEIEIVPGGSEPEQVFSRVMDDLRGRGRRPFFIPTGGSTTTGALGYVAGFSELMDQLTESGIEATRIVHASSSGGTQAGLVAGSVIRSEAPAIHGINVYRADHQAMLTDIHRLACATAARLGAGQSSPEKIILEDGFVGPRYGIPTDETIDIIELLARTEGILLDPVYSGKAMAGLVSLIQSGRIPADEPVVFLHTGGVPALFAYEQEFNRVAE